MRFLPILILLIPSITPAETNALFLKYKLDGRTSIIKRSQSFDEAIPDNELENFLDEPSFIQNIEEMEKKKLTTAKLKSNPWSDDYWAIARGILGARYTDDDFFENENWNAYYTYVYNRSAKEIFLSGQEEKINKLSPSEKYDLLFSDEFLLTQRMWEEGRLYYERYGKVESWMGICHGWAPASYMMERPQKMITLTAYDGKTKITFYPSDIKALASLLWAKNDTPTKFAGSRCHDKDPTTASGRIQDETCRDSNPATWHISAVNQIGVSQRSFIIDSAFHYEVWNQPVISYQYTYYNPKTGLITDTLSEAIIDIAQWTQDNRKIFRHPKTKKIVGIYMSVEYGIESTPLQREVDSEKYDRTATSEYKYDLELNANNEILGGEWQSQDHPDFLWNPIKDARALSGFDLYILDFTPWDQEKALPENIKQLASSASQQGSPLGVIVENLIKMSNNQ